MAEYSIDFSEKLLLAAKAVADDGLEPTDAVRTVLYLSSLASEITLKALLEKAGMPVVNIMKHRHDLSRLLKDLGKCKIRAEVVRGQSRWVSAARVRAITVDKRYSDATIGTLLTGEKRGASKYPNQLRYGDRVSDYPPRLRLKAAQALLDWAREQWDEIRLPSKSNRSS